METLNKIFTYAETHHGKLLIIIMVLFLLKELLFVFLVPPFTNKDEAAHFLYVQYLVEEKKLPVYEGKFSTPLELSFSEEYYQARLAVNKAVLEKTQNINLAEKLKKYQQIRSELSGLGRRPLTSDKRNKFTELAYRLPANNQYKNAAVLYPPLYYLLEALPYKIFYHSDVLTRLYAMRVFSTIFFLLTLILIYLAAKHLTKNLLFSLSAIIISGLQPIFSYVGSGVNNDVLLVLFCTLIFYLCLKLFDYINWRRTIILGLVLGLGLLTKQQFLVFLPLAFIPFLYHFIKNKTLRKKITQYLLIALLITVIIAGWWFLRNYQLYHNFVLAETDSQSNPEYLDLSFGKYLYLIAIRYLYAFTTFGFNLTYHTSTGLPPIFIFIGALLSLFGFAGLLYYFYQTKRAIADIFRVKMFFLLSGALLLEIIYTYLFLTNLVNSGIYTFPVEGRYYFPVILPIILLWLWGLVKLIPQKFEKNSLLILISFFLITHISFLALVIFPRFYL